MLINNPSQSKFQLLSLSKLNQHAREITLEATPDEDNLDVEKDIIVRMQPREQRQVQLRVKHLGRAKPRVVYDPLPLD